MEYSSLLATIDANIRANGNEEITGPVLNGVLRSMVSALGNGFQFKGIAQPDDNPGTPDAKVFYLATTPGTYANFDGATVTTGQVVVLSFDTGWHSDVIITAASLNGSSSEDFTAKVMHAFQVISDTSVTGKEVVGETVAGDKLQLHNADNEALTDIVPGGQSEDIEVVMPPKSGTLALQEDVDEAVGQLGQQVIYDVTKNNPTAGPNNDGKFESLSALLSDANLSTLIPIAVRCGGMSIRFVQTSDNKYVQYRLMSQTFSTADSDWQGVDDEPTVGSDNLVKSGGVINYGIDVIGASCDINIEDDTQIDYSLPFLKTGNIIEITLLEDSIEPDVMFYTRTNRQAVENIGRIRVLNGVIRKTLTADSEDIYAYNNNGRGNIKFKVTKLGVIEDINNIKNTLNTVVESVADNTESIENLTSYTEKKTGDLKKTFVNTNNKRYDIDFLKAGNYIEITLDANTAITSDVIFYTQNGITAVENIGTIYNVGDKLITKIATDAEKIYSYSNNGGTHDFTIRLFGQAESLNADAYLRQNIDFNNILNVKAFVLNYRLGTSTWLSGKAYVIPVDEGGIINVKGNKNTNAYAGFLSELDAKVKPKLPISFVGTYYTINANTEYKKETPANAKYFVINILTGTNNEDTSPQYVYYNDVRVDIDIRNAIGETNRKISGYQDTLSSPTSGNLKQTNINDSRIVAGTDVDITIEKANGDIDISIGYKKASSGYGILKTLHSRETVTISCPDEDFAYLFTYNNGDSLPYSVTYRIKGIVDDIKEIRKDIEDIDLYSEDIEIADGVLSESCVDDSEYFIKTRIIKSKDKLRKPVGKNILAVNHDDFRLCDIEGVRRVYNKYGFAANFNFMLVPFSSIADKNARIAATKKLLREGNGIGLHNYFGGSFWWMNKLFDIRPDGTSTYAPTLSELQGANADHTGTNSFGTVVTAETKFSGVKFETIPSNIDVEVATATEDDWRKVIGECCVYFNRATNTSIDLNDASQSWTYLHWAEYFYNELIDNTLGYSSQEEGYAARFAEDYEVPEGASPSEYYPDITHLENGKIVFFDDISNPNYNNNEYQKVGRIKKGLFKGCASVRNCEVVSRIISVAEAYCRHYYGMVQFDNFGRHGERFYYGFWEDVDGFKYEDRNKTILAYETQKVYISECNKFKSLFDILKDHHIKMSNHGNNGYSMGYSVVGQQRLFLGQSDIVGRYFNQSEVVSYLDFFGTVGSSSITEMTYETFKAFTKNHDNWLKWAYESAGQVIYDDNGNQMQMYSYIKKCIDTIRRCLGTGKIPAFSLDTIRQSPNIIAAVEILCQFCWANDISIVPMEVARKIACHERNVSGNLFSNPGFNRTLLDMLGGSSSSADAYLPDGWDKYSNDSDFFFTVETNNGRKEFTVTRTGNTNSGVTSRVYGLPEGKYKFSCYVKTTNESGDVLRLYKRYNSDKYYDGISHEIITGTGTPQEWTLIEQEFSIETPYRDISDTSAVNRLCDGYSNNVAYIGLFLSVMAGESTSIAKPSIIKIG